MKKEQPVNASVCAFIEVHVIYILPDHGPLLKRNQPYSEPQPLQFSITFRKLGTQKQPVTSIVLVQTENAGECVTARKA